MNASSGLNIEKCFQNLENLLKNHDWYYEMSDDFRAWSVGKSEWRAILTLVAICLRHDVLRTETLVQKYTPERYKPYMNAMLQYYSTSEGKKEKTTTTKRIYIRTTERR